MSSAALVDAFFPTSAAIIDAWPGLRGLLLSPPWARRACPAPAAVVAGVVSLAWPSLLALTLASVPFALLLAVKLERAARRLVASKQQQEELRLWRDASALFAGMNAAAAFAHCLLPPLLPPSSPAAALAWPLRLARAADVAFTGASSSFLIAASAARCAARRRGGGDEGGDGSSARPRNLAPRRAALALSPENH